MPWVGCGLFGSVVVDPHDALPGEDAQDGRLRGGAGAVRKLARSAGKGRAGRLAKIVYEANRLKDPVCMREVLTPVRALVLFVFF